MIVLSRSKNAAAGGVLDDGPDTSSELARSVDRGGHGSRAGIRRWTAQPLGAIMDGRRGQVPNRATVGCPARPGEVQLNPPELNHRRPPSIPPDGGRPIGTPAQDGAPPPARNGVAFREN